MQRRSFLKLLVLLPLAPSVLSPLFEGREREHFVVEGREREHFVVEGREREHFVVTGVGPDWITVRRG